MIGVSDLLANQALLRPEHQALVGREKTYTYAELEQLANQVAQWLVAMGVQRGDRVVLLGANRPEWVVGLFGTLKAGAALVPIQPNVMPRTLHYLFGDCTPSAVIIDQAQLAQNGAFLAQLSCPVLVLDTIDLAVDEHLSVTTLRQVAALPREQSAVEYTPDDLAAVIYTSGTTKNPKGVIERHRNIVLATQAINAVIGNRASDVVLCGLPFSFDYGLYQILLCVDVGATLVIEPNFDLPLSIPRLLRDHHITGLPGVPSLFAMLLRSRLLERVELPALRYLSSTGDVFPPTHIDRLRELLPHIAVFSMYGLTECKRVSILPPSDLDQHRGSVGRALPGTHVTVLDEAGQEHEHGIGELVVRGPHVMAGYWNDPSETAKRFVTDPATGEPALRTSDRFRIDEDGYLYFIGRDEMIIKRHGRRISVTEIESFLCSLHGVAEAAVIGMPDQLQGETIYAYISTDGSAVITPQLIRAQCIQHLAPEACPEKLFVSPTPLPKTANGKQDRVKLRREVIP